MEKKIRFASCLVILKSYFFVIKNKTKIILFSFNKKTKIKKKNIPYPASSSDVRLSALPWLLPSYIYSE